MAGVRDITLYKGDYYTHQVNIKNSSNTAINITGRTYVAQMRKSKASGTVIASFTTSVTDGVNGILQLSMASNITSNINTGIYYYDLQETNSGIVTTLMGGKVTVIGEVSRG